MLGRCGMIVTMTLLTAACVSDVDFDQAQDIVVRPRFDLDLLFFAVDGSDFDSGEIEDLQITLRDTTRLEFLDDNFIQEDLKEIELRYEATNSFRQSLINTSRFVNNSGETLYEVSFPIEAATGEQVVLTEFLELIPESDLEAIRNSIQIINEVRLFTNGEPVQGVLELQSKAIYTLEFSDL